MDYGDIIYLKENYYPIKRIIIDRVDKKTILLETINKCPDARLFEEIKYKVYDNAYKNYNEAEFFILKEITLLEDKLSILNKKIITDDTELIAKKEKLEYEIRRIKEKLNDFNEINSEEYLNKLNALKNTEKAIRRIDKGIEKDKSEKIHEKRNEIGNINLKIGELKDNLKLLRKLQKTESGNLFFN